MPHRIPTGATLDRIAYHQVTKAIENACSSQDKRLEPRNIVWDPKKNATIFMQPTGGPTPGSSAFARHAGDTLGDRLTPYYNVLDPIPRAWSTHGSPSLDELPWLYPDYIEPTLQMFLLFGAAKALVLRGGYTPLPGLQPFLGKFNSDPSVYPLRHRNRGRDRGSR